MVLVDGARSERVKIIPKKMSCRHFSWQAQGIAKLRFLVEMNVTVTYSRVSGCGFEGLGLRNCLAGLQSVLSLMRLPASRLKEVLCETLVLERGGNRAGINLACCWGGG